MKISVSYRITSLILALFIFLSSSGISLDIHYCGKRVFDYSLVGAPETCSKALKVNSNLMTFNSKGCCSSDHFKINTSDDFRFSDFDKVNTSFINFQFASLKKVTFVKNSVSYSYHKIYPPPEQINNNDIYLKIESFLI